MFSCEFCHIEYSFKCNLVKHLKVKHGVITSTNNEKSRLLCPHPICEEKFSRYDGLRSHLVEHHQIKMEEEKHIFSSETDFNLWRMREETTSKSQFVMDSAPKALTSGALRSYYICHRSYNGKMVPDVEKQRRSKSIKTNKCGFACPAMLVATKSNSKIEVIYFKTHFGHKIEMGRQRLSKSIKDELAEKLKMQVPMTKILDDIRDQEIPEFSRIHLLEKKDLHNIRRDYSIGACHLHSNDAVSVDLWVKDIQQKDKDFIIIYKKQGEEAVGFEREDFCLVFMTPFQKEKLMQYGADKICIDGTHGLNSYNFQLFTLLVVDGFGNGIPVAFCFSNRQDTELFKLYFNGVKGKVGAIKTKVFMSDDYPAFYNAWESIMGAPSHHLLCTWHVFKNWAKALVKIHCADKKDLINKILKQIHGELDKDKFQIMISSFITEMEKDPDVSSFLTYFKMYYMNDVKLWAMCYRTHLGINTNMFIESFHRKIKHDYLDGKVCKRLDSAINALLKIVRDCIFMQKIKLEKVKYNQKLLKIYDSHSKSKTITKDMIRAEKNGVFFVKSSNNKDEYEVMQVEVTCMFTCSLKCDHCSVCIHLFQCKCVDNTVHMNICKHIHAVIQQCNLSFDKERSTVETCSMVPLEENLKQFQTLCKQTKKSILINQLLNLVQQLKVKDVTEEDENLLLKHADKMSSIVDSSSFIQTEKPCSSNSKIPKQQRFYSTKKVREITKTPINYDEAIAEYLLLQSANDLE